MRTIGVLGGIGPQATMDFEARVHEVSQARIPQKFNTGYPPMVVYYLRTPPLRLGSDDRPIEPVQPSPGLLRAAADLGKLADFLVITSNFPHVFQRDIEESAGVEVLSMIDRVMEEVRRRDPRRVGVVGLGEPAVYLERLRAEGLALEALPPEQRERLDPHLFAVMEGRQTAASTRAAEGALEFLRRRGAEPIILGCSELPILLRDESRARDLIDPLQLLAEAAVERAMRSP